MQGFYEFCDNDGVLLPGRQGVVHAVVKRPPRRKCSRRILWRCCGHPPDDNDDDDDDDDNDDNDVGVTLFAGNVYYSWQAIRAALLVPIAGIILIEVILGWATGLNKSADVVGASKLVKWWGPVWTAGEMFDDLGIVISIGISAAATMSTQCNQSMEHIWSTLLHNRWNVFVGCRRNISQRVSQLVSVADLSTNSDMASLLAELKNCLQGN
jgi:hypothetical protein